MNTIIMDMKERIVPEQMERAGKILRAGGLVAFPTETVYGLGGDGLNPAASQKIYAAKGRPSDNPLIIHIAKFSDIEKIAVSIPPAAEKLAAAFWPGPLTMILQKSSLVPLQTTGGLQTVAIRFPSHPVAQALIKAGGGYIAAPSANLSGRPSPTSAAHVITDLDGRVDAIIDGGDGNIGLESTIIDLTEQVPVILRPGFVSLEMAREVLGEVQMDPGLLKEDPAIRPKAPGMKYRHYAPRADLIIVRGEQETVAAAIRELCEKALSEGKKVGITASDETRDSYRNIKQEGLQEIFVRSAGQRADEQSIARHLYALLREFDILQVDLIYSEAFDTPRMGQAIMNRLIKAAGHQMIDV